jgi:hypothetical protein
MKVVFVLCGGEAPNSRAPKFMSRRGCVLRTQEPFAFGDDFSRSKEMQPSSTGSLEGVPWPCLGLTKGESGELFFI